MHITTRFIQAASVRVDCSAQIKARGIADGKQQLVMDQAGGAVRRQLEQVHAGRRGWQALLRSRIQSGAGHLDAQLRLQVTEAQQRRTAAGRHEAQESRLLVRREALQRLPASCFDLKGLK